MNYPGQSPRQQWAPHHQPPPHDGYSRQNGYPGQTWAPPPQAQAQRAPVAPRRRRVWPWVLLGAVMAPVLLFVACSAVLAGGVAAVDNARQGGTVAFGETFTYQSGLALSAAAPTPYDADNEFIVGPTEQAFESLVTITNGTGQPVNSTLITMNVTAAERPAERIFLDAGGFPTQDIAPGQALQVPLRFKVPDGTTGALQVAVTDTFNEPVFFNGQLG